MPKLKFTRANDLPPPGLERSPPPDLTDVVGRWFNTSRTTGEIAQLDIQPQGEKLLLQVTGAGSPEPIPWPPTIATPFVSSLDSRDVTGFVAHCDFGFLETQLVANIKYGVLVIQSYNQFQDGSGRGAYFTREFFHQAVVHDYGPGATIADDGGLPVMMAADVAGPSSSAGVADLSLLTGRWLNTKRQTKMIRELELTHHGDAYVLHAYGAGAPRDWGEVQVTPHAGRVDARDPAAFHAVYDFGFLQMFLAANLNKGLLIIASYNTFRDGSTRSNYFSREFFYHVDRP